MHAGTPTRWLAGMDSNLYSGLIAGGAGNYLGDARLTGIEPVISFPGV